MNLRKSKLRESHSELDIGPLNDILFILLMFFLMISTLANPNVIKLNLPKAKSDTEPKPSIIVDVDKNNNVYIESKTIVPADSVKSVLESKIKNNPNPSVVIRADEATNWGGVVRVMKIARNLGATTSASVTGTE